MQIAGSWQKHRPPATGLALLVVSFVVAAAFGAWRASTVRLWGESGQLWRQGTPVTAVLWLLALAAHLGIDAIGHFTVTSGSAARTAITDSLTASIVLYRACSFGAQRAVVDLRAARMGGSPGESPYDTGGYSSP